MTVMPPRSHAEKRSHTARGLRGGELSAIRGRHVRHDIINALRNAHKMAFFPSVPRTVQESFNG
jgi:hypothetical protein